MISDEREARGWLASLPGADAAAIGRLEMLAGLLAEENARQNLVSAASLDHLWQRHIADSAQLLLHVADGVPLSPWLDLGTGAGFPGLVVAALRPECEVVMVESRPLRVEWLLRAGRAMGLARARVIGEKVERLRFGKAAVISARAFAPLDKLLRLSSSFSTSDTRWVLPKGRSAQQELAGLRKWRHTFHVEQSLTDPQAGIIVGALTGGKETRT